MTDHDSTRPTHEQSLRAQITRLEEENKRLRAALDGIRFELNSYQPDSQTLTSAVRQIVETALTPTQGASDAE